MSDVGNGMSRRRFFRWLGTSGVAGVAGSLAAAASTTTAATTPADFRMPVRPLGRTGVSVPILCLGTTFGTSANMLLLRQAVKWGVTYWDTARYYDRWGSESGIGKYLTKYPEDRKKIFLASKSLRRDPVQMTEDLQDSLDALKTDYLDLFYVHAVSLAEKDMTPEIKAWGDRMKSEGKIRLFGFSTHADMAANLSHGATLGWIDAILTTYNYRVMVMDDMKRAMDACHRAGIGLTAMKTQAYSPYRDTGPDSEESRALAKRFLAKGVTEEQAKHLAVWNDDRIASICSLMRTLTMLKANAEAAVGNARLSVADCRYFSSEAAATAARYCTGCTRVCQQAIEGDIPVGDIMRYLMYARSYGDYARGRAAFKDIPASIRDTLKKTDYAAAELLCPQGMPIGRLMAEAVDQLV